MSIYLFASLTSVMIHICHLSETLLLKYIDFFPLCRGCRSRTGGPGRRREDRILHPPPGGKRKTDPGGHSAGSRKGFLLDGTSQDRLQGLKSRFPLVPVWSCFIRKNNPKLLKVLKSFFNKARI